MPAKMRRMAETGRAAMVMASCAQKRMTTKSNPMMKAMVGRSIPRRR
jgi:hypothetical protein